MVSVGEIMYRLQDNPLLKNVKKSDVVNHIKTVINLLGVPGLYEDKLITLDIYDFRSQIPSDFVSRTAVRRILTSTVSTSDGSTTDIKAKITLTHNTDEFYNEYSTLNDNDKSTVDMLYTHKIVGDFIYVDFEEGQVEMSYKAVTTDENGWPMIDSDDSVILATEWYIKRRYYEILWSNGKLPDKVFQHSEQQYRFYMGQATNALLIPDPVEAEAIGNAIIRLIPQTDNLESNHKYDSQKERLRSYRYR